MTKESQSDSHPNHDELVQYGLGKLKDAAHQEIEDHVANCDLCCRLLQEIPNDPLVANLQQSARDSREDRTVSQSKPISPPSIGSAVRYFGDYELLDEIARGGMGVVFRARQTKLNRIVALKMILGRSFASAEEIRRFQLEAEAAAQLKHRGIVPIFEVGEHEGHHFYSMEYVDGDSLATKISQGPMAQLQAAIVLYEVASAVQFAHQQGLIHRDLKPANILIDRADFPRITDFGLAKRVEGAGDLTASGQVMGTPGYMPPEQAGGHSPKTSEVSDVYSLGATLYAAVTGRPPFQADNSVDTLIQVVEQEPVSPRLLNPNISRDLETICLKCLEKERTRRYQSAEALADELERFIQGRPIVARPITRAARGIRWCRRNPVFASLVTVTVFALLIGSVVSAYFGILANQRLTAETKQRKLAEDREKEAINAKKAADAAKKTAEEETAKTKAALFASERSQYFNMIHAAQLEWQANNPQRARTILNSAPRSLRDWKRIRNWEWDYLQKECNPETLVLRGHKNWVMGVAFSPSENLLASCSKDQSIRIWNLGTGDVQVIEKAHENWVYAIAFSPDGKLLASGSQDTTVKLWNVESGKLERIVGNHRGTVEAVAFRHDGAQLASVARDRTIHIWDLASNELALEIKQPFAHVYRLSYSPDGKKIAVVAGGGPKLGGNVLVFDVNDGKRLRVLSGHQSFFTSVDYNPDGSRIAAGSYDGSIVVWDSETGEVKKTGKVNDNFVTSIAFHPTENQIAAACADMQKVGGPGSGEVVLWNTISDNETVTLRGHHERVRFLAFDKAGNRMATAGYDNTVRIWNHKPSKATIRIKPEQGTVFNVSISTDSKRAVTAGRKIKIWDLEQGTLLRSFDRHSDFADLAMFHPDGIKVASGGRRVPLVIWDSITGKELHRFDNYPGELMDIGFHPDGEKILWASKKNLKVFEIDNRNENLDISFDKNELTSASFDTQGNSIAVGHRNGSISLREAGSGAEIWQVAAHRGTVTSLRFSPNDSLLASSGLDGTAKIWNVESGQLVHVIRGHTRPVHGVTFSPDGKRLVTGSRDTFVKIWDVETGQSVLTLRGHPQGILGIDWSADGSRITSVGYGDAMMIWNGKRDRN